MVAAVGFAVIALALWVIAGDLPREWEGPTLIRFGRDAGVTASDIVAATGCIAGETGVIWAWYQVPKRGLRGRLSRWVGRGR